MPTRRSVLCQMSAALIPATVAAHDQERDCREAANRLKETMQTMHGGEWHVEISHEAQAVSVFRKFSAGL